MWICIGIGKGICVGLCVKELNSLTSNSFNLELVSTFYLFCFVLLNSYSSCCMYVCRQNFYDDDRLSFVHSFIGFVYLFYCCLKGNGLACYSSPFWNFFFIFLVCFSCLPWQIIEIHWVFVVDLFKRKGKGKGIKCCCKCSCKERRWKREREGERERKKNNNCFYVGFCWSFLIWFLLN